MKHVHLRKDKTCLNCGKHVTERFCSHCGQENTEPIESFGHLLNHFFADVTHYDSKFFTTIKYLIFKPGFLTREYNAGKRLSYLNPIRMYIFISAIFFLLAFSNKNEEGDTATITQNYKQHLADSLRTLSKIHSKDTVRSALYTQIASGLDGSDKPEAKGESLNVAFGNSGVLVFHLAENRYKDLKEYNTVQSKLADTAKDSFISRYVVEKIIRLNQERGRKGEVVVKQNMAHNIPKVMFILLPLFALFVAMLYGFYRSKNYLYSQHAIFSLHFHSLGFLVFIFLYFVSQLNFIGLVAGSIITTVCLLGIFIYLIFALHAAYQEKLWLSTLKAFAISIFYILTVMLCNCIIFAIAFMMI